MLTPEMHETLHTVADILADADSALFITGAGISADSGLPTYRGVGGLYNRGDTEDGMPIETALGGEMMAQRPEIAWKYIARIEQSCRGARFNRGHEVIAQLEKRIPRIWVLTQNVDGFHRAAGSANVIDIHGDVHYLACTRCPYHAHVEDYARLEIPPRCPDCRAVVRPRVVLFGELLPPDKLQVLGEQLDLGFDIVFSIGTTSVFPYIAQPVHAAARRGVPTVEINPAETVVSHYVDYRIAAGAAETLDAIRQRLADRG